MTEVKSVRFPEELMAAIQERARRERLDESTTIRQLVSMGLREYACQLYRDGEASLREAADLANLPVREMVDVLQEHGVRGNVTLDQQRKAIQHALDAVEE